MGVLNTPMSRVLIKVFNYCEQTLVLKLSLIKTIGLHAFFYSHVLLMSFCFNLLHESVYITLTLLRIDTLATLVHFSETKRAKIIIQYLG